MLDNDYPYEQGHKSIREMMVILVLILTSLAQVTVRKARSISVICFKTQITLANLSGN